MRISIAKDPLAFPGPAIKTMGCGGKAGFIQINNGIVRLYGFVPGLQKTAAMVFMLLALRIMQRFFYERTPCASEPVRSHQAPRRAISLTL